MDRAALGTALLASLVSCSSNDATTLPPLGEAVIVIDTDLPLTFAQRLRIDVFVGSEFHDSRDVVLPSRASFPVSFSVYSPNPDQGREATVRLRIYPEGRTRDYHGERFAPRIPNPFAPGARAEVMGDETPRLVVDGVDRTPKSEPIPLVTVDRLLHVKVTPGRVDRLRVTLRGECLGTMADLRGERTCIDREGILEPAPAAADDHDEPSRVGTFATPSTCTAPARIATTKLDGEVCVAGGLSLFGVAYAQGLIEDGGVEIPALFSPFYIDRYEVTVARFRAAIAAGFVPREDDPIANDAPFDLDPAVTSFDSLGFCSWSKAPLGREDYALSCISRTAARDFCRFAGGDLPSEPQWYQAAVITDRPARTPYPWGDATPDCRRAVFSRTQNPGAECPRERYGPAAVDAALGDATIGLGIIGMHGGLEEWTGDAFHRLYEGCWYGASLHDPTCTDDAALLHAVAGVSFREATRSADQRESAPRAEQANHIGFRCVRPGT